MNFLHSTFWNTTSKDIAPIVLRIGLSLVFLWFSYSQLTNPEMWTRLVPEYAVSLSGMTATTLVYANGIFELVFGLLLLAGLFVRVAALLLALHLVGIINSLGYGSMGVRDFGLCLATFAVFFFGNDKWCLGTRFAKKN